MSSGISNFNTQTGLAYNNPEFPRIGFLSCNDSGGSSSACCCVPIGGIIMYNDTDANFPNYELCGATWNLCDGNNGTIDLRNSFVLGNDINANLGTTGGATSTTTTITLTAADLPQHNHSIPALAVQVNTGVPATLNIPGVGTTQPNQNGVAGDPANVAHLHRGFGNSASQPAAVALFKRFYAYAAGVCPPPDPPLAGPDVAEGTIYCGYYCGGAIQAAYGGAAAMDNSIQWTGGIYTGGGATALDSHTHSTTAQTVNLPSLVGSTAAGTTGDTGTAPPIIITSGSIAIIPPYTKLYYIQRTA